MFFVENFFCCGETVVAKPGSIVNALSCILVFMKYGKARIQKEIIMKKAISAGQVRSLIASFTVDVPWEKIGADVQPFIDLPPDKKGKMFAAFIANNFRLMVGGSKLTINPSNVFNPAEFIGNGWGFVDEDRDARSYTLTTVDFSKVQFSSHLKEGEASIKGEENLNRQKETGNIRLGVNVFFALWLDYQANGENSVLEWMRRNLNITYLDFFGDVLLHPRGDRSVLCLRWRGSEWYWACAWLGHGWKSRHVSAELPASPQDLVAQA